jgi:hypothetical protein
LELNILRFGRYQIKALKEKQDYLAKTAIFYAA